MLTTLDSAFLVNSFVFVPANQTNEVLEVTKLKIIQNPRVGWSKIQHHCAADLRNL